MNIIKNKITVKKKLNQIIMFYINIKLRQYFGLILTNS